MTTKVKGFNGLGNLIDRQCDTFKREILTLEATGAREVGLAIVGAVSKNLGGPRIKMSGVGKNGATVGVVLVPAGKDTVVKMTGPAQLIENDTKAHTILGRNVGRLGKGKGSRSASAKRAAKQELYNALFGGQGGGRLNLGGDQWVTGPIPHPGTKGKHPFRKGVDAVAPVAPKIFDRGVQRGIRKAFNA